MNELLGTIIICLTIIFISEKIVVVMKLNIWFEYETKSEFKKDFFIPFRLTTVSFIRFIEYFYAEYKCLK